MRECPQTPTQSVLGHGLAVYDKFTALRDGRTGAFRLPEWWAEYGPRLQASVLPEAVCREYLVYHDCGKPLVRVVDEDGKQHFPNHSAASRDQWLAVGGSREVAKLIFWDMALHVLSAAEITHCLEAVWVKEEAATLLLAALAEVHSNADMFGGIDSTSFKIKLKHLDRRGRQVCKFLFG